MKGRATALSERLYMADFVLANGTEITFDLDKMTYGQWLGLFDVKESDERSDATLARVSGLKPKDLKAVPFPEYKRLLQALLKKAREPLADPN
jgi:hypothetical protein